MQIFFVESSSQIRVCICHFVAIILVAFSQQITTLPLSSFFSSLFCNLLNFTIKSLCGHGQWRQWHSQALVTFNCNIAELKKRHVRKKQAHQKIARIGFQNHPVIVTQCPKRSRNCWNLLVLSWMSIVRIGKKFTNRWLHVFFCLFMFTENLSQWPAARANLLKLRLNDYLLRPWFWRLQCMTAIFSTFDFKTPFKRQIRSFFVWKHRSGGYPKTLNDSFFFIFCSVNIAKSFTLTEPEIETSHEIVALSSHEEHKMSSISAAVA